MGILRSWNVIRQGRVLATVYWDADVPAERVRRALVEHNAYPEDIWVAPRAARMLTPEQQRADRVSHADNRDFKARGGY